MKSFLQLDQKELPSFVYNIIAFCIFTAGISLRFYKLNFQPLWAGELFTLYVVSKDFFEMVKDLYLNERTNPPLYWIINKFIVSFSTETTEASLRFLSALAGSINLLLFIYVRKILDSRMAGLIFLVLLAFSTELIYYSQEARPYALAILLSSAASLVWLDVLRNGPSRLRIALLALANSMLVYTHYYGAILVFLQGGILLFYPPRKTYLKTFATGYLLPFVLFLPIIANVIQSATSDFFLPKEPFSKIVEVFLQYMNGSYLVAILLIGLLVASTIKALFKHDFSKQKFAYLFLALVCAQFLVVFILSEFFTPFLRLRYFLVVMPPFAIAFGIFASSLQSRSIGLLSLIFCGIFLLKEFAGINQYTEVSKDDSRSVAAQIISWHKQQGRVRILGCCQHEVRCDFYFNQLRSSLRTDYIGCRARGLNRYLATQEPTEYLVYFDLGHTEDRSLPDIHGYGPIEAKDFNGAKAWLLKLTSENSTDQ